MIIILIIITFIDNIMISQTDKWVFLSFHTLSLFSFFHLCFCIFRVGWGQKGEERENRKYFGLKEKFNQSFRVIQSFKGRDDFIYKRFEKHQGIPGVSKLCSTTVKKCLKNFCDSHAAFKCYKRSSL